VSCEWGFGRGTCLPLLLLTTHPPPPWVSQFFKSILEGGKVDVLARYQILREAVSGTMSNFLMARDRETEQIVGLKILDRKKTDALEARFKGLDKPTEGEIATAFSIRGLSPPTARHHYQREQFLVMGISRRAGLNSLIIGRSPLPMAIGGAVAAGGQAAQTSSQRRLHPSRHLPRNFVCSKDARR
jgi:serine/threonine-protein kinase